MWFFFKRTKVFSLSLIFLVLTFLSFQTVADLIYQGQTYIDTAAPVSYGINVPRSTPTNFQFLNNYVSSINVQGYMIQAGDEGISASNGNLNGEIIKGNKFDWKGDFAGLGTAMTITHGVFTGCNIDVDIKHNYLSRVPMGIIRKSASNMVNTKGGVSYNIVKTFNVGGVVKGMSNVNWYNNTFYQDRPTYSSTDPTAGTWRGAIDIYTNTDVTPNSAATGTKVKNNIFYSKYKTLMVNVMDAASLTGFECDYNVYWVEEGDHTPVFNAGGTSKTWDQWRAMGYDAHSVVMNPNFIDLVNFVPAARLDYGTNLGTEFNTGLSTTATWTVGSAPSTTVQNGTWQVGARVYAASTAVAPTVPTTTAASSITQTTAVSGGTITSDGGSPITAKGVCWDQSGGPALDNPHTNDGTGTGAFTSTITGLTANTLYYVRSYATNAVGTGYGPRIQFTTASVVVAPTVTTTAISTITPTAATGGGNVTSDGGSAILERGVCWNTSTNPTTANNKQASGAGTGVFTSAITGLTPVTVYYVRAYARNAVGTSYGANVTFTTAAVVPVAPYYVSATGNDATGDGTITKPWFTLEKAWSYVKAGETIYMRGGTYPYKDQQILTGKSGTSTNKIQLLAYNGERPIITKGTPYATPSWPTEAIVVTGNYLYFKGLDVSGFPQGTDGLFGGGMRAYGCNYSTFELLDIHHNGGGFQLTNCNQCYVINSDFHHNQDPYTGTGSSTSTAGAYGNADGMGVDGTNPDAINYVRGCRFWYNTDDGIDGWAEEGTIVIENCWSFWNGFIPDTWNKGGDGSGFKLGKTDAIVPTLVKRKLYNNISFQNKKWGFLDNGIKCNAELYNNTAIENGYKNLDTWAGGFHFNLAPVAPYYIKNNISYKNIGSAASIGDLTNVDHNSWDLPVTVTDADFVSIIPTGVDGPRQADGSLPVLTFLKLAQGSDLINKGINVGLPYKSTAPDLGAYESDYSSVPVSPYFVSTSGNDIIGDGTIDHPWFTLNKAWSYVKAGETVYMRGGTYYYNETQNLGTKDGTVGNMIKLFAYNNEDVIIRPSTSYTATVGVAVRGNYLHLKGLDISYFEQRTPTSWYNGITAYNVYNCIFEQLDVHHNGFGFSIGGTSNGNLVLNSDFHHNWDPITAIEDNRPYGGSDGLTIRVNDPSSLNIVRGCRMWNNSDDGFDGWSNSGMLIFEDCWSFNNGYREDGVTIGGDGNGFKMGPIVNDPYTGYETVHKRTMNRCIAFNNRVNGFDQNASYAIMYFYNNFAFGNGNHGFVMNNTHTPQVYMIARNNISYKNKGGQGYFNSISAVDHNTFNYNNTVNTLYSVTDADFISIDPAGSDGPRQPDGSLPNLNFLKLALGSDLIERGVDVGLPFSGNYPDLGPFETNNVITIPKLTTTPMTNVTINSAVTGGNVTSDGSSPITARGVCWSTSPTPTIANSHTNDGTGSGVFTSNLTGLIPNTTYYVRAYATNAIGTAYGEELVFTTLKELFLATVTTTVISSITENSGVGGGNVTFDGNTAVTARGVCWNTTGTPTIADAKTSDGVGLGVFTSNLPGLLPNTLYYVRAYVTNSVGTSYGEQVLFTTLKQLELPVVGTAQATSITENSAISGGNVTFDGNTTVTARGVCWNTTGSPTVADDKTLNGTGTGIFVSNLASLLPNTLYYIRAYATNSVGTSYGSEILFTTLKHLELPVVTTTPATDITETSAITGGNVTFDGNDPITSKGVCWNTSGNPTVNDNITFNGPGAGVFTSSLTGLADNTTFYVRAYATNSIGVAYGEVITFTTLKKMTLPVVTTANVTNITQTTAVGGGNVTFDGYDFVTARGVVWSTDPSPTTDDDKTLNGNGTGTFTSSISPLTAETMYFTKAYAINSIGIGYGEEVSFTTDASALNYLLIYPNPVPSTQNQFTVKVEGPAYDSTRVEIYDMVGRLRYQKKMTCFLGLHMCEIKINKKAAGLTPAVYIVKVLNERNEFLIGQVIIL